MSDNNKHTLARTFKGTGRAEMLDFEAALEALLINHQHKLHTVLFKGE